MTEQERLDCGHGRAIYGSEPCPWCEAERARAEVKRLKVALQAERDLRCDYMDEVGVYGRHCLPVRFSRLACFSCGLAGDTPAEHFPQEPGPWDRPCPQCGGLVWVTEAVEREDVEGNDE